MGKSRIRMSVVAAGLAITLGCSTYTTDTTVSYLYYFYGPEDTLEVLQTSEIAPENRALADLERAMVLLELGRYEDSLAALGSADVRLETRWTSSGPGASDSKHPPWRPEYHERVLASTLAMANSLALYDVRGAAAAADRALARIEETGCAGCGFAFTRVLASLAYGGARRFSDGLEALAGVSVIGHGGDLVDELRRRLERGAAGVQPEGLAPPPVESDRFVVAILMLGRGPYKDVDKLALTETEKIQWCRYLPRDPQAVTWAAVDLEDPVISVEFTDVEELAAIALDLRARRVVDGRETLTVSTKRDLRHWTSLPASLQLMVVEMPPDDRYLDFVYYSPEGLEVDRETIELPAEWWGGPIYVTRRMP